jgi:hypothetical protein
MSSFEENGGRFNLVIPAGAGIHLSAFPAAEEWVPACGTTKQRANDG